jgi:hypothetical protein
MHRPNIMLNIVIESKFKHPINVVFNITIIINVGHKHGAIDNLF